MQICLTQKNLKKNHIKQSTYTKQKEQSYNRIPASVSRTYDENGLQKTLDITTNPDIPRTILPTPKNSGQTKMAVIGAKHCSSIGNMHDLNVNSSDKGATTCTRSHFTFCRLSFQWCGSESSSYESFAKISDSVVYRCRVLVDPWNPLWRAVPERGSLLEIEAWRKREGCRLF